MTHLTFQERKNIKLVNNGLITKEILNNGFNNISQCIVHTITAGLLPFLISTRFKYIDLNSIIDGKDDIISIKNDSKTVWELFELFLFDKVNRNEELNWDFNKVINSDMIKNPIKNKLYNIIYKNKYTWNKNKIFNVLTENVCEFDKKTIGDVPTSYNLVKEILGHINTFGDGSCIDLTCGNGTFLWEVKRIAIQNGYDEKDVMNNIFGIDLNLLKCYITSALLDPTDEYESNIYCGDALHTDTGNIFNMKKFKYIVGNPPFQKCDDTSSFTNLWADIVLKSVNLSSDYVAMITPTSWKNQVVKKTNASLVYDIIKNNAEYLNIDECKKHFKNIGSSFSYYIINKHKINKNCYIKTNIQEFDINLNDVDFIPNSFNNIAISILKKLLDQPFFNCYHTSGTIGNISNKKTNINIYSIRYSMGTEKWSDQPAEHQYTPKLIFPNQTTVNYPIYGPTSAPANRGVFYKVKNEHEAKLMLSYIKSKLIQFLISQQRTHHGVLNTLVISRIPKIDISRTWTDDELYEHFNLTSEEIKYIEDTVK